MGFFGLKSKIKKQNCDSKFQAILYILITYMSQTFSHIEILIF